MDAKKDIECAALRIVGLCSKIKASKCSVNDGIYQINCYAERIEDRLKELEKTIRELRQKNGILSKKNWNLAKEIADKERSLNKMEDELQSSQLSLSALCEDSDDNDSIQEASGHNENEEGASQNLFSDDGQEMSSENQQPADSEQVLE